MSRYMNPALASLTVYVPGEQPQDRQYIKLNTNELPFPPSPRVVEAVNAEEVRGLRLYPDPDCRVLRAKLAKRYGVEPENVFLSNGSDDILNFSFLAFGGKGVIFPDITYGFYPVYAALHRLSYREIPLRDDFSVNPVDYIGSGETVVLANPNAPTGKALTPEELEPVIAADPDRVVLIDEAYVDFGARSCVPLTKKYPNLLVVQTFSKSRAMAGARLGFAIADRGLIDDLNRIRCSTNPYNINRLTLAAAVATLDDEVYFRKTCAEIAQNRAVLTEGLRALGFTVPESQANFVFAASNRISGKELYLQLKASGILVRHFEKNRIGEFNRITVGTREQNTVLLTQIEEILAETGKETYHA